MRVPVPTNRYTPVKENWKAIYTPVVENMKLQIRMNTKLRCIELQSTPDTVEAGSLQKAADFVRAFVLGFEVKDALAMLRMEDLYIESFRVEDGWWREVVVWFLLCADAAAAQ